MNKIVFPSWRRHLMLLTAAIIVCAATSLSTSYATTQSTTDQPEENWQNKIVAQRTFDFGDVPLGKVASHKFELVNTTDETLHISSVSASCGCTTPVISKRTLAPGEKLPVKVQLNTARFRGKKKSTIHIRFDKPTPREIQLSIDVNIRNMTIEPETIDFTQAPLNQTVKKTLSVSRGGSPYWKINSIKTSSKALTAQIIKKSVSGTRVTYEIECSYTSDSTAASAQEEIIVTTNDSQSRVVAIPARIKVVAPIRTSVSEITFDHSGASTSKKKLFVQTSDKSQISKIDYDQDLFKVTELKPGLKKVHLFEIELLAKQTGANSSTLMIEANEGALKCQVKLSTKSENAH